MHKNYSFIAVVGPDGVGKTTLVNGVIEHQKEISEEGVKQYAANFEILPTFTQIKNLLKGEEKKERNIEGFKGYLSGMKQKPNDLFKSLILIVWSIIDLNLGRFIIYKARKNGDVIFFARYFYDYFFQISNKNVPYKLLKFFLIFVPKPELVFYLERNAEDIFSGKPELSVQEIKRQQMVIERLSQEFDNFICIDASCGDVAMIEKVVEIIKDGTP
jgi:thymidylate kinase